MVQKTALVTGASSGGLGSALCSALHSRGVQVLAALRDPSKAGRLRELSDISIVQLDVTSSVSIQQAVQEVQEKTGGKLDVLVNNAGVAETAPALDMTIESAKQLFDVNLWGVLAVTQAFAPLIIESKGTIVNISSAGGYLVLPWSGVYSASKAALTSLSQTLRVELEPFGVRVLTAILGGTQTNLYNRVDSVTLRKDSIYEPARGHMEQFATGESQGAKQSPDRVASDLVDDILKNRTGLVWRGGFAGTIRFMTTLPGSLMEKALKKGQGLELLK